MPRSGSGGFVPSTPTLRKRLSRKSPGPELKTKRQTVAPPSNVVGPDTVSNFNVNYLHTLLEFIFGD